MGTRPRPRNSAVSQSYAAAAGAASSLAPLFLLCLFTTTPSCTLLCLASIIYPNTALTPSSPSPWTSPNSSVSLGFFPSPSPSSSSSSSASYYVSIWYASLPRNQSIIWTANRDRPVSADSALRFTSDGRLLLTTVNSSISSQQTIIWAASTLFFGNVVSDASQAELLDDGNFVLRDNTSSIVWQSFDHPTDTLLPNQNLTFSKNLSLVPWVSVSDPSPSPKYTLVFGRTAGPTGHIRLLSRNVDEYWSEPPPSVTDTLFDTTFTMDAAGTLRLYNGDGSLTWVNTSCDGTVPTNAIKKLQLGVDGNLRVLAWSNVSQTWNTLWRALYLQCDVFDTCGENSICDRDANNKSVGGGGCPLPEAQLQQELCSCPQGFTRNGSNCDPPASLNCSTYMTTMDNTSFGVPTQTASVVNITLQDCKDRCLNDCNCTATSYMNSSSSCWLYNTDLYNGVRGSATYKTSFIKTIAGYSSSPVNKVTLPSYAIAVIVVAPLLFAALLTGHQLRSRQRTKFKAVFLDLDRLGSGLRRFSLDDLYMVTGGFDEKNKLGTGGSGSVYRGTFKTPHGKLDVAVKKLNPPPSHGYLDEEGGGGEEDRTFMAEIKILGCIKHSNVLNLIGFCAEGLERLLVYEHVANGSLSRHIFSDSPPLSWDLRFRIAVDAATGIEYLHTHCPKKIVHRDIKPDNILLDENLKAKVADFGVSQIMGPERTHLTNNTLRGTLKYMAPECLNVGAPLTEKADTYSYGVVLLELLSGKMVSRSPYIPEGETHSYEEEEEGDDDDEEEEGEGGATEGGQEGGGVGLVEEERSPKKKRKRRVLHLEHALDKMERGRWESLVDERLEGVYNLEDAGRLLRIVFWCLQGNPVNRPSMEGLVLMIKGHKDVPSPPLHGLFDVMLPSALSLNSSSHSTSTSVIVPEHL